MINDQVVDLSVWFPQALLTLIIVVFAIGVIGTVGAYLASIVIHGPVEAFYVVARAWFGAVPDWLKTSPRRVMAIARLSIQETIRRRILLVVVAIFALALLVGGWFLDSGSQNPHRTYLGFVLAGTQFLVLFMGLLVASFSIPSDIQNKTIFTVVTKPVRANEIVLGRVAGFMIIGTLVLGLMGLISYLFVVRGLAHSHEIDLAALKAIEPDSTDTPSGKRASVNAYYEVSTSTASNHNHRVEILLKNSKMSEPQGAGASRSSRYLQSATFGFYVNFENGHEHVINASFSGASKELSDGPIKYTASDNGDLVVEISDASIPNVKTLLERKPLPEVYQALGAKVVTGEHTKMLQARVPLYAETLSFTDRDGNNEGVDVGKLDSRYKYVEGGVSLSKATFDFKNVRDGDFDSDFVEVDLVLKAFRTHKGNIERRIPGSLRFVAYKTVNDTQVRMVSPDEVFESNEYNVQTLRFSRQVAATWKDTEGNEVRDTMDLIRDFAQDGKLSIELECEATGQYLGVAPQSVYFKKTDNSFFLNYFKCFVGIWLQLLIVTTLCVSLSTFLNASVSLMGTVAFLLIGFQSEFIKSLVNKEIKGGGPFEALYRLILQLNVVSDVKNPFMTVLQGMDAVMLTMMQAAAYIIPDFNRLQTQGPLADGYDINFSILVTHICIAITFGVTLSIIGCFCFKSREIAG